jgi:hypothetical protein
MPPNRIDTSWTVKSAAPKGPDVDATPFSPWRRATSDPKWLVGRVINPDRCYYASVATLFFDFCNTTNFDDFVTSFQSTMAAPPLQASSKCQPPQI